MIILDRFEGNFAVVEEDGKIKNFPRELFDENITEGSVVVKKGGRYFADDKETAARRKEIAELQDSLFED